MTQLANFTLDTQELAGQVALITGGGRGLGRAFAQALAEAGVKVAVTARTEAQVNETAELIVKAGGIARAFTADVTDRPAMERIVAEVEQQFGPLDLLVNNAAIVTPLGYDWEVDLDEWWRTLEINVRGPFLCTKAVLPGMMARHKGRIINVSSGAAYKMITYGTAYGASKAALSHMTKLLAAAIKEYGISIFALGPGGPTAIQETIATSPNLPEQIKAGWRAGIEKGVGIAESVQMLLFLVSGQADFLTGRHIHYWDSIDELIRRADDIIRDDLYTLGLRV